MPALPPSLRKAAVLIAALDERAAETILEAMSPEEAAKVRSALVELDEIPLDEQQRVLADFFQRQGAPALQLTATSDVALELSPAAQDHQPVSAGPTAPPPRPLTAPVPEEAPLAFLAQVPAQALAAVLRRENPQIAAVVIAQLPPDRAALVLEGLPAGQATDALERMAWLDEIAPEILADLARELRQQLAPHLRIQAADAAGLGHLAAVLGAMGSRQRERTLQRLVERDSLLGKQLGARPAPTKKSGQEAARVSQLLYRLGPPLPRAEADGVEDSDAAKVRGQRQPFAAAV
jgi:flagellar motor switch protein FliG